ncbi:MAG: hypothetical protein M3Q71_15145, partial [Chloroflexota bacterium]|nr:hypothetical protein [Chloroflexota bacterium]
CMGTNRDGTPCSGQARPGRSMCAWHDPQLATERAAWRQKGGQSRSNKARARKRLPAETLSLTEVEAFLSYTLKATLAGKVEPGVANAVANVARTMTTVVQAGEMEGRLRELEAAAGLRERRRA